MGEPTSGRTGSARELDGNELEDAVDALGQVQDAIHSSDDEDRNTHLDWLEGREAHGYLVDMLFAQQYARWNRELWRCRL